MSENLSTQTSQDETLFRMMILEKEEEQIIEEEDFIYTFTESSQQRSL